MPGPLPLHVSQGTLRASKNTYTTVVVSTSVLGSRTPTPVILLISSRVGGVGKQLSVKLLQLSGTGRALGQGLFGW